MTLLSIQTFSLLLASAISLAGASAAFAGEQTPKINLAPTEEELNWGVPASHRDVSGALEAPLDGPETTNLLERNGITPDVRASRESVGASQRIELGTQGFADTTGQITPYVELGADVAKSADQDLVTGSTINADVTTGIGGGTVVNLNDQVDFKIGVTRQDSLNRELDAENKVESGVSIKF